MKTTKQALIGSWRHLNGGRKYCEFFADGNVKYYSMTGEVVPDVWTFGEAWTNSGFDTDDKIMMGGMPTRIALSHNGKRLTIHGTGGVFTLEKMY